MTATHSGDPKDPGVAPGLSIAQQRSGVLGRRQRSVEALSTRLEILFGSLRACVQAYLASLESVGKRYGASIIR